MRDTIMERFENEYETVFAEFSRASGARERRDALHRLDTLVLSLICHARTGKCAGAASVH